MLLAVDTGPMSPQGDALPCLWVRRVLVCSLWSSPTSTHSLTVLTALMIKVDTQRGLGHSSKWPWILFFFYPSPSVGNELVGFPLYCSLPVWKSLVIWCHGERAFFFCPSWLSGEARRKAFAEGKSCLSISRCRHLHKRSNLTTCLEAELSIICESVAERGQQRCPWTLSGPNSATWLAIEWASLFRGWLEAVQWGDESLCGEWDSDHVGEQVLWGHPTLW